MNTDYICHRWPHKWYGFWRGGGAVPDEELLSIADAMALDWNPDDKASLVAYLRAAPGVYCSTPRIRCLLCSQELPQINYSSDDVWIWPVSLAHYVMNHPVVLPDAFVEHIREREYVPPEGRKLEHWQLPWPDSWTGARVPPQPMPRFSPLPPARRAMPDPALGLNYRPTLPRRMDWRIGCIGSGFIMRDCHLVAYRSAGFNPVAIASRNEATAQEVAKRHNIPTVQSIEALLANPEVEILDVAVPPDVQPDLIRRAVEFGKGRLRGILAQKPLALSLTVARDLVRICADAGIVLAVNQNMRFDQSVRAAKDILNRGWLGEVVFASIDMRAVPHWMPWAEGLASLSTFVMSIHHLDTFRYWLGTPDRVLASTRPDPRTKFPHRDGLNLYILEYDSGARASAWDDVWAGPYKEGAAGDSAIRWRVEGTEGLMQGTIGWPKYPEREPSRLQYSTRASDGWQCPKWSDVWFPDAFVGTMAQLLVAVEQGTEPEISGRDNLETVALCEAVFSAATQHRVVSMKDVLDTAWRVSSPTGFREPHDT